MLHSNVRRQRLDGVRASLGAGYAAALVLLLSLASLSVAATAGATRAHPERIAADLVR